MKREPELRQLSRDHHHALVLARRARRAAESGSEEDVSAMWNHVAATFHAELGPHFEVEEQYLLPPLEAAGEHEVSRHTRSDHARLRNLLHETGDARARLLEFGKLLRDHVRFEENELFPCVEQVLDDDELAAVARASVATSR